MKLIYPVRNVKLSQLFGPSPIDYSRFGLKGHNGIDFAGQIGDEILAAADGTVIHVGYEADGYGHFILIDHGQYVGVYAHLKKILVNVGQRVAQGKQIAEMGNSGNSTGPHLHFGIRPKVYNRNDGYGGYIDPMPFFNRLIFSDSSNADVKAEPGTVIVVAPSGVRIRLDPRIPDGEFFKWAYAGEEYEKTGRIVDGSGLQWAEINIKAYIAIQDIDGVVLLEDKK